MNPESHPDKERNQQLEHLLSQYGDVRLRNPHNESEILLLSETPEKCPPFIEALLRADGPEQQKAIVDMYEYKG